ncbi:MAG: chase2 sensor protein [Candidatus Rokuibacteriota bacterium]|nr:MAG: chase2 sensor protein [Candidatus Rokubacteria bacterium]
MHWSERRWVRVLGGSRGQPLGIALLALVLTIELAPDLFGLGFIRLAAFDAYQRWAPRARHSGPAVIVAIDEESLRLHGQWPWPRTWLAQLVARIAEADPAAIGVDILMPEADRLSPARLPEFVPGMGQDLVQRLSSLPSNDTVLARTLQASRVVLGVAGLEAEVAGTRRSIRRVPFRTVGGDPRPLVRRFDATLHSAEEIDRVVKGHGLLSVDTERGVVRRMPLVATVGDALVPAFGIEMLRVAAGGAVVTVRTGASGVEALEIGDLAVPTEPDGSVRVHFARSDPARFVSAADVLAGKVDRHLLERKLVLIGVTALGLSDYQATPVTDRMPGVEIHAQLLENIFDTDLLSRPRAVVWAEAGLLLAGGLLLILTMPRSSPLASVALYVLMVGAIVTAGALLYLQRGILLDAASPSLALGTLFTAMLVVTLAETERHRQSLRRQVEQQREQAARLAGELEAARRIQMGSLPDPATAFPGDTRLDLYAFLEPAREVGGDLYDFFPLDRDRLCLLIGDVSGKGLPGSLFMAVSKALYKSAALRGVGSVDAVMREADGEISRDNAEGLFVTMLAGILDVRTGLLEYCNAGHEPLYLLPNGDRPLTRLTDGGGPPLCVLDGFPYAASARRLTRGDTICLVTDGVLDAMSPKAEAYGRTRFEALLEKVGRAASAAEIGEAIRLEVSRFADGVEQSDDMAILVLRWKGPSGR